MAKKSSNDQVYQTIKVRHFQPKWKNTFPLVKRMARQRHGHTFICLCLNDDKMFRSACLDCQEELCDASSFESGYSNFRFKVSSMKLFLKINISNLPFFSQEGLPQIYLYLVYFQLN